MAAGPSWRRLMRGTLHFLGGLLVVGLIAGCNKGSDSPTSATAGNGAGEIVIGHVGSLTGDTATFGTSADEGIRQALDEINAAGGVLGKKIKVITEDDRSLADEARTAAI